MTPKPSTLRKIALRAFCGLFFVLIWPAASRSQFLGYTSPQSVTQTLAAAGTACTGSNQSFSVSNLGQTQHFASVLPSAAVTNMIVTIIGRDASLNNFTISDAAIGSNNSVTASTVSGTGYFPVVFVQVLCNGGTFTLSYTGTSSSPNVTSGAYLQTQIDKAIFFGIATNTSHGSPIFVPPFGSAYGKIIFSYLTAGIAGSTFQVNCSSGTTGGYISWTFALANTVASQVFQIPDSECTTVQGIYTSGGASANNFNTDYIFSVPGQNGVTSSAAALGAAVNLGLPLTEKGARWDVLSTPAVSLQATASKAAGAAGVRHVADCVSYSAGAIAAPAATTLFINLRDGATGVGTVIWSKTVTIPATAAPHYDFSFCGLNLIGTAATAMTLEFSVLLTNESESVTLTGYDVQ